tara:strand:+ start:3542 stop:3691 length:150 start_codon:yes stop_codon:yes gene_type:complete
MPDKKENVGETAPDTKMVDVATPPKKKKKMGPGYKHGGRVRDTFKEQYD